MYRLDYFTTRYKAEWQNKLGTDQTTSDYIILDNGAEISKNTIWEKLDNDKIRFYVKDLNYWSIVWKDWTKILNSKTNITPRPTSSMRRFMKLICRFIELDAEKLHELLGVCCDVYPGHTPNIETHVGPQYNVSVMCLF